MHKLHLEREKETLLITLYAKAMDNRSKCSILNDVKAEEMLNMIDYDFEKINSFGNELMVVRAKQIDTWLRKFLKNKPDATVLNLGCGLDTRFSRIQPQSSVSWYDIDFPEVINVRKLFYTNQEGYKMIASSVTDAKWFEHIPSDKPTMVIAEGVLEYLTEDEVKTLFNRITSHFPQGQIMFDVMNTFAIKSGKENLKETTGAEHKWTVDYIQDVDHLNTKLKRIAKLSIFNSKFIHQLPLKYRLIFAIMRTIPRFRNMMRLLLYQF